MSDIDFEALVQNVQCKYTYIRRVISQRREVLSTELAGCILLWIFKEYCIDIEWWQWMYSWNHLIVWVAH